MIPPAPADFWDRVIDRVAKLIWERETAGVIASALPRLPPLPRQTEEVGNNGADPTGAEPQRQGRPLTSP